MSANETSLNSHAKPIAGLDWVTSTAWPETPKTRSSKLTVVDLFSSCGAMTLGVWEGARRAKKLINVRLAVELMPQPCSVYETNFSDISTEIRQDDVARLFDGSKGAPNTTIESYWKGRIGDLDLLLAGPPCQGHSDLNNSTRRKDPRNVLYLRVIRAAEVLRPKVIVIENVPTVQHDHGKVVSMAEEWLKAIGYHVVCGIIQLSRFGVPQSRKRHILFASSKEIPDEVHISGTISAPPLLGGYLSGLEDSANTNGLMSTPGKMKKTNIGRVKYLFENELFNLPDEQRPPCHRDKEHAYVSMYGRMHWDKPAQTLTSGFGSMGQGRYIHPTRQRLITPHEAARLQGIPDFFDFSSVTTLSALREMIANAVPPQFTATLTNRLIEEGVI